MDFLLLKVSVTVRKKQSCSLRSLKRTQNCYSPAGSFASCFSYTYTYWTLGVWIYPLYYHLTWTQRIMMNVLTTTIVPSACYLLGEAVANTLWGETLSCHAGVISSGNSVDN